MSSSFSGITTALSSLRAQRQGLDVAGQNIANVNTKGYSRQRLEMTAIEGVSNVPTIWTKQDPVGSGVNVDDISRVRDELLESRVRTEHANNSYISGQDSTYDSVQSVFKEPSDTGLQERLSTYWSDWQDLSNNPGDGATRTKVIEQGATVTQALNEAHAQLSTIWSSAKQAAGSQVAEVNTSLQQIADLNHGIVNAKVAGLPANELADQRDALVMRVSELTGATAAPRENGAVDMALYGNTLVAGSTTRTLALTGSGTLDGQAANPVAVTFADTGKPAPVSSGELGSSLDSMSQVIPKYSGALDGVAAKLASSVNGVHTAGFDKNGAPGGPFFSGTTAATISVAISDPDQLAASASPDTALDGSNADAIGDLATSGNGADVNYRSLVADLGVTAKSTNLKAQTQQTITSDLDSSHESQSGVSLDEEMSSLLTYQRAYEAAAKLMNTVDSTLNTLINSTGR
jgi:flagellar hook-associated protein 1 FlgK